MATAAKWTSKIQMGWEVTRGTAVNASRLCGEIIGGWFTPQIDKTQRPSLRGSLTNMYDPPITAKEHYELKGVQIKPSYPTITSYLEMAVKGTAYASNINTAAYSRVYQPSGTTDDLRTATFEIGLDTVAYQYAYGILDSFTLNLKPDAAVEMTADFLMASETAKAFTSVPNPPVYGEEIGAYTDGRFLCWVDSSTMGSTAAYPLEAQFTYSNNWQQLWVATGSNTPYDAYRNPYTAELDLTLRFDSTTEYDAFRANTLRKVRLQLLGSAVTGSSPSLRQSMTIDWYGYWSDAPVVEQNGLYVVKTKGMYVADPTTRVPFSITVVNDRASIL